MRDGDKNHTFAPKGSNHNMNDRVMETKQGSACLYGGTKSACHNTTLHDGRKEMCTPQHKKCARHIKKCACHNTRNVQEMCMPQHKKCARNVQEMCKKCACHNTGYVHATTQEMCMPQHNAAWWEKKTLCSQGGHMSWLWVTEIQLERSMVCASHETMNTHTRTNTHPPSLLTPRPCHAPVSLTLKTGYGRCLVLQKSQGQQGHHCGCWFGAFWSWALRTCFEGSGHGGRSWSYGALLCVCVCVCVFVCVCVCVWVCVCVYSVYAHGTHARILFA